MRKARFEKKLAEIRALINELDALDLDNDIKLERNLLIIWANSLIGLLGRALKEIDPRLRFLNRLRYRSFVKQVSPQIEKKCGSFLTAARSFRERILNSGGGS